MWEIQCVQDLIFQEPLQFSAHAVMYIAFRERMDLILFGLFVCKNVCLLFFVSFQF